MICIIDNKDRKKDQYKSLETMMFKAMLHQLRMDLLDIEHALAKKYCEDFVEQLAADLLSPDKYEALMKIKDKEAPS